MITPEMKDQLLIKLIEAKEIVFVDRQYVLKHGEYTDIIITQFVNLGLLSVIEKMGYGYRRVRVEAEAYDLIRRGGFKFAEDIFMNNIKKLDLEIKKLEKDIPADKFDVITKTIGALAAGVGIYTGITT